MTQSLPGQGFLPLNILVEILVNGTWVDISKYVMQRDGIIITGGRAAASDQSQPATMTLTLKNGDGRFTPNYASGAYYPYLQIDQQIRVSVDAFSATGNHYSGYRFWGEVTDWPPQSDISGKDVYVMLTATGPLRRINTGGGWGSALARYYDTLTGQFAPVAYWPCEEDPDSDQLQPGLNGGQPMNITSGTPIFKADKTVNGSAPIAYLNHSTWDGLTGSFGGSGNDIFATPGTYEWIASTATVDARCWGAGAGGGGGSQPTSTPGGGGGGGAFSENPTLAVTPGNSYPVFVGFGGQGGAGEGNLGGGGPQPGKFGWWASITGDSGVVVLAQGGLPGQGASGVTPGAGGQGGGTGSGPTQFSGGAGATPTGVNGGGGGASAGTAAAGNPGGTNGGGGAAVTNGGVGGQGGTPANGFDGKLPTNSPGGGGGGGCDGGDGGPGQGAKVQLLYSPPSTPPANVLRFICVHPRHGGNNGKVLVRMLTGGTIAKVDVQYDANVAGGGLRVFGYNSGGSQLFDSGAVGLDLNGEPQMVSVELTPSGSSMKWYVTGITPGASARNGFATGTVTGASIGNVTECLAGPNGDVSNTAIGHISVQYGLIQIEEVSDALNGHVQEMTVDRLIRLCAEAAMDAHPHFAEGNDHWGFEHGTQGWTVSNGTITASDAWATEGAVHPIRMGVQLNPAQMGYPTTLGAVAQWQTWTNETIQAVTDAAAPSDFTQYQRYLDETANGAQLLLNLRPAYNPVSATDFANMTALIQWLYSNGRKCEIALWGQPFLSGLTSAQFITMFQYYTPAVNAYYPMAFVTSLHDVVNNSENSYYPGDSYVDVIGTVMGSPDFLARYSLDSATVLADTAAYRRKFSVWDFWMNIQGGNYLTQPDQGFESVGAGGSIGRWLAAGGNPTLAPSTLQQHSGNASMLVTSGATGLNRVVDGANYAQSFESGTGAWFISSGTGTLTQDSTWASQGSDSLRNTISASGQCVASSPGFAAPCVSGDTVLAGADIKNMGTVAINKAGIEIAFFTAGGIYVSSVFSPTVGLATGVVQLGITVSGQAPATATKYTVRVGDYDAAGVASGRVLNCDNVGSIIPVLCAPVTPGDSVGNSCWFRAATTAASGCAAGVNYWTATGQLVGSPIGTAITDSTSAWTQSVYTGTAPTGAAYMQACAQYQASAAGQGHYLDDFNLTDNSQGLSHAQTLAFFDYLQNHMGARHREGKELGDLVFDNTNPYSAYGVVTNSGDFRLPYIAALTDGTTLAPSGFGHSLQLTSGGATGQWYASSPTPPAGQPVNNGDRVAAHADVFANGNAVTGAFINIDWYNAANTYLSSASGSSNNLTSNQSLTIKVAANAPAGAAAFRLSVGAHATAPSGVVMNIDHVRVGTRLGVQERKALREFIRDIKELEQGMLAESRILNGLHFRSRITLVNQTPAIVLDYSKGEISNDYAQGAAMSTGGGVVAPLTPVFDDLLLITDVDIRRHKGGRVKDSRSTAASRKRYRKLLRILAETDAQLLAYAEHLLNIGSWTGERYPNVAVNLLRAGVPIPQTASVARKMSAIASVDIGDYVQIINLPFYFPSNTAKQMVIGYTEYINAFEWSVNWNCAPESPFEITSTSLRRW